jgi:WD40 repeat protein
MAHLFWFSLVHDFIP